MQTLVFGIYLDPNNPTDLVESYYFHFTYPSPGEYSIDVSDSDQRTNTSKEKVQKHSNQLVRRLLLLTQSLEPLPENAYVTVRLYYNEGFYNINVDTPIEYQPENFKVAKDDLPDSYGRNVNIGKLATDVNIY